MSSVATSNGQSNQQISSLQNDANSPADSDDDDYVPVFVVFIIYGFLAFLALITFCLLNKRAENYTLNLRAMVREKKIRGVGDPSKEDCLRDTNPSEYMSSPLIPLVENRYKSESAQRYTKQKGDARTVLDSKKIKNYKLSGNYSQKSRLRCWRVPRVVVKNEYFVEVIKTSKPQLKQKGKEGKKEEEEEDLDTLSKGPPVLDMYADPVSDSDDQSQPKHKHDVTGDNWGSRTSTPDNESLHFATDSDSQDTEDQLMPTKDEALVVLGKGSEGRKRSFVRNSYNKDMTRSGIQPQRVKTEKRMPYFN